MNAHVAVLLSAAVVAGLFHLLRPRFARVPMDVSADWPTVMAEATIAARLRIHRYERERMERFIKYERAWVDAWARSRRSAWANANS